MGARFPCELWQQEHTLLHSAGGNGHAVLCEVDVWRDTLQDTAFEACCIDLSGHEHAAKFGVHALATWTEVEDINSSHWRGTATLVAGEEPTVARFAPGPFKQG